jgi:hypothetical protein
MKLDLVRVESGVDVGSDISSIQLRGDEESGPTSLGNA